MWLWALEQLATWQSQSADGDEREYTVHTLLYLVQDLSPHKGDTHSQGVSFHLSGPHPPTPSQACSKANLFQRSSSQMCPKAGLLRDLDVKLTSAKVQNSIDSDSIPSCFWLI